MTLTRAPLAVRLQRPLSSKLATPAGLTPLGGKGLGARRGARSAVAVRAQLEDALGDALSSAPSAFHNLAAHLSTSLFLLGDVTAEGVTGVAGDALAGAAAGVADAAAGAADAVAGAVDAAPVDKGGFFGVFSNSFEAFLKVLDGGLEKAGIPYSYGFAIITLTLLVKLATYPLTKKQVESTLSMQAMAPKVKALQAKYANDPERLQMETAKMYQTAGVNPLAGCLPSLATIPVFIGLYRALSNVAEEGLLTDGFFWIPSLAGPTTVNGGLGWIYQWQDGIPPLGFRDTAAYLIMPVLLVVSQFISQKVISPQQSQDPSQAQANAILKFLPLMIGYFSLNVPSGLTLYWFTNNLVTTAQQLYLRRGFTAAQEAATALAGGPPGSAANPDVVAEPEKRGPTGKDKNARRSQKLADSPSPAPSSSNAGGGGGGGDRGEKFRAIKAREAARMASQQAVGSSNGSASAAAAPAAAAAGGAAVAVVAEVASESDSESEDQPQHQAANGAVAAGSKGGKKKGGGKRK